jgi:hypothetical protein
MAAPGPGAIRSRAARRLYRLTAPRHRVATLRPRSLPDSSSDRSTGPPDDPAAAGGWSLLPNLGITPRGTGLVQGAWFLFAAGFCVSRASRTGLYLVLWAIGALVLIYVLQRLAGRPATPIGRGTVVIDADTPFADRLLHDLMSIGLFAFCAAVIAVPPALVHRVLH